MSNKAFGAVMGVLAVIALLAFGVFKAEPTLAVGDSAPDRPLPTIDGEGESSLADFAGSWVLVNFWASWCAPCEAESPDIQAYLEQQEKEGNDFVVFGIDTRDSSDDAQEFIDEHGLTWEMVRDGDGKQAEAWATTGVPETFLVDPAGTIALICRGPLAGEQLDAVVTPFLDGSTPTPGQVPICDA